MEERNAPLLGLWGWLVLVGMALVALGVLVSVLSHIGDLDGEDVAPVLFNTLGVILASMALGLAGLFVRGQSTGVRVALVIAGAYLMLAHNGTTLINFLLRF